MVMPEALAHIMRTASGYTHAIPLLTACQTRIFAALGRERRSAGALARELGMDERALETVLLALVADGFLTGDEAGFALAPGYGEFLLPDGKRTRASILSHHAHLVPRWARLPEVLRSGEPVVATQDRTPDELRAFICGMANLSRESSLEAAEKLNVGQYHRMLDLGGGPGTAAIVFARANPELNAVVFDLPDPIEIAREEIAAAGLEDRIDTMAGDFMRDDIGADYDLVYIANIIHMLGPEETEALLRKARAALVPGGTVAIKDFYLDDSRAAPNFAAFFSINMLVNTPRGKSYTRTEVEQLLTRLGFQDLALLSVAEESAILTARKGS